MHDETGSVMVTNVDEPKQDVPLTGLLTVLSVQGAVQNSFLDTWAPRSKILSFGGRAGGGEGGGVPRPSVL